MGIWHFADKGDLVTAFTRRVASKLGGAGNKMDEKDKDKLLAQILISAEQNKDRVTFQSIGKMLKHKFENKATDRISPQPQ